MKELKAIEREKHEL